MTPAQLVILANREKKANEQTDEPKNVRRVTTPHSAIADSMNR